MASECCLSRWLWRWASKIVASCKIDCCFLARSQVFVSGRPPRPPAHFCWEPQVCIKSSWNFLSIIEKCIKINVVRVHFSVTTLFKYKTTFEVTDPPARASRHVMTMGGTVPYFIDLGNREMKSDWFKFRLRSARAAESTRLQRLRLRLRLRLGKIDSDSNSDSNSDSDPHQPHFSYIEEQCCKTVIFSLQCLWCKILLAN